MNKLLTMIASAGVVAAIGVFSAATAATPAFAAACSGGADCVNKGLQGVGDTGGGADLPAVLKNIVNVLLFVIGAVAVIMIVVGGIKYTTSNGDSNAVTGAKNTIFYAIIGLILAVLAYAIVNFVVGQFVK